MKRDPLEDPTDGWIPRRDEVEEITSYYLPEPEVTEILDAVDNRTSAVTGHSRLAFAVISQAFFDATAKAVNEDARSFILNLQRGSMLPFWCHVAELPLDCVVAAAKRLADDGWKRPANGSFLRGGTSGV